MLGSKTVKIGKGGSDAGDGMIRVLLCEDHEVVRSALVSMLALLPDIEVVAEASDGAEAIVLAQSVQPDVIVMDLEMPGTSGFEAIGRIRENDPGAKILVLSAYDASSDVRGAIDEGATGYIIKGSPKEEFFQAIRDVAAGGSRFSPSTASRLLHINRHPQGTEIDERELTILRMVAEGSTNKEIGAALHKSERTVKAYVGQLAMKLGVTRREQAAAIAIQRGLIRIDDPDRDFG
jgi:DNA-binding NarL/FixJ family response regulator